MVFLVRAQVLGQLGNSRCEQSDLHLGGTGVKETGMTDWSQIVQEHGPMVWRTARRLLDNDADAGDCFQRTFVSALEFARKEAVRNWAALLQRLVTARALECLRQRRRDR